MAGARKVTAHSAAGSVARGERGTDLPSDDDLLALLSIRAFEQRLLDLFETGELNGTTHTCLGQEYVPVALAPLIAPDDRVFGNHRSHGHYLSLYPDPVPLLAEIMGRAGALCHGVGGSQHLLRDRFLSTGVLGENVSAAAGAALMLKRTRPRTLALAYVGDGTWGEGAVYEALNMASLWRLPQVLVVENNGIAQSTPTSRQLAGTIGARARAFGVEHLALEGFDLGVLRSSIAPVLDAVRLDPRPVVLEFRTERAGPHSKGDDTRPADELDRIARDGWYASLCRRDPERVDRIARAAEARIDDAVETVRRQPPSAWVRDER